MPTLIVHKMQKKKKSESHYCCYSIWRH